MKELTLHGVRIHSMYDFKSPVEIVASGVFDKELKKMISKVFVLDEVSEAFNYAMTDKKAFKTLICVD
jgi:threonine dehydrogenase-like Zn-dependent dehydrogenase